MSDEVKKILEQLKDSIEYPKIDVPTFDGTDYEYIDNDTLLEPEKCKLLLNYITNLQEQLEIKNKCFNLTVEVLCETSEKSKQLQKENERLKLDIRTTEKNYNNFKDMYEKHIKEDFNYAINYQDYKSRCENANEYIKKNTHEYKMFNKELGHFSNLTNISIDKNNKVFIDDLLKILNGGDEKMTSFKDLENIVDDLRIQYNQLLELCMYALIRDTKIYNHVLDDVNKLKLMNTIRNNLNNDTYTLRNKLIKVWENGDDNQ